MHCKVGQALLRKGAELMHCKVGQLLLQGEAAFLKLKSGVSGITKWGKHYKAKWSRYYKMGQLLQSWTVQSTW